MSSPEFLQETLEANLRFQSQVVQELERIARRKAENRHQAARLLRHVVASWKRDDEINHHAQLQQLISVTTSAANNKHNDKWKYDPYRRWTRRFFVDPQGKFPPPNLDVIQRRELEQQQPALCHTNASPWSPKETKLLQDIVDEKMKHDTSKSNSSSTSEPCRNNNNDNNNNNNEINFEEVALALHDATRKRRQTASSRILVPRTAQDCRLRYLNSQKNMVSFTKQESLHILEQVHVHDDKQPNWIAVAQSLEQQTHRRTAWQCLCHYQTKLVSSPSAPWTIHEDELLFWYLAAMGPQFVLDLSSAANLSSRLLPDKIPKQIMARANQTLLNPNLERDTWTDEEQRKLVLCMKIYRDSVSPLTRAAAHFPHRASKSVAEKWNRSLNPEFSARPFTAQEDQALIEAIRSHTTTTASSYSTTTMSSSLWSDIAKLFPHFQIQRLYRRWRYLASDEDLAKYGCDTVRKAGAKRGIVGTGENALLNPDDFVVQVKKKRSR